MKKLLVISFTFLVAISMSSCTSSDANKDNGQTAASSDENMPLENGGDFGKDAGAIAPADGQAAAGGLDDVPLDGSVDATKSAAAPDAGAMDLGDPENEFPADVAKSQKDGVAPTDDKVFADAAATPPADTTPPPPDVAAAAPQEATSPPPIENTQTAEVTPAPTEAPVVDASAANPAAVLPYEKIKTEPFEKKGAMLNRVYLARKGDTAKAISQKIYGSPDHVKDLKAWNGSLKNHAPRVGDKIYYTSPKDPQDTKMAVFYEEMGVEAQHYTTQAGDDIRKVSTKLLGHKDSWKEIYATNANLDNKMGKVAEGMDIRFCSESNGSGWIAERSNKYSSRRANTTASSDAASRAATSNATASAACSDSSTNSSSANSAATTSATRDAATSSASASAN
jgi:hypothetical protein